MWQRGWTQEDSEETSGSTAQVLVSPFQPVDGTYTSRVAESPVHPNRKPMAATRGKKTHPSTLMKNEDRARDLGHIWGRTLSFLFFFFKNF